MAFTLATENGKRTKAATANRQESEFDGLWINVGVHSSDEEGEEKFVRLPRGIAVSDLVDHKVYANTNEDWAAEATLANTIMNLIREEGMKLDEGESMPVNLSVQLYRRQETVEQVASVTDTSNVKAQLFG